MNISLKNIYEEILQEGKQVGIVYHFTSLLNVRLMTSNFLDLHPMLRFIALEAQIAAPNIKLDGYISTTRQYDFPWKLDPTEVIVSIRFTLDGNKISQKYFVEPFDYRNRTNINKKQYVARRSGHSRYTRGEVIAGTDDFSNEYEERIWGKQGDTIPLKNYCLEVLLIVSPEPVSEENKQEVLSIKEYFENLNIPTIITTDPKPYGRSKEAELKIQEKIQFNNWVKPDEDTLYETYGVEEFLNTVERFSIETVSYSQLAKWIDEHKYNKPFYMARNDIPKTLVGLHNIKLSGEKIPPIGTGFLGPKQAPGQSRYITKIVNDIRYNNPVEMPVALRFKNQPNNLILLEKGAKNPLDMPDEYGLMRMSIAKVFNLPINIFVIEVDVNYEE
jgi:hypothetical protein